MSRARNARRNAEIVQRRRAGEWPTEIAVGMGLNRNVVIGVCFRAGLANSVSPNADKAVVGKLFAPRGERHGRAKLSAAQVAEIRATYRRRDPQYGQTALARSYGVSPYTVWAIVHGRSWLGPSGGGHEPSTTGNSGMSQ